MSRARAGKAILMYELLKAIKASEIEAASIARQCREEIRHIDDVLRML